jgi:uncharacterized protein (DUF3820 family)
MELPFGQYGGRVVPDVSGFLCVRREVKQGE